MSSDAHRCSEYGPYMWNLSNLYTTGEVTLTAIPEPDGEGAEWVEAGPIEEFERAADPAGEFNVVGECEFQAAA